MASEIDKKIINEYLERGWTPDRITTITKDYTAESCLNHALKVKKTEVKQTTFKDYVSRVRQFKQFLRANGLLHKPIEEITKREVSEFLNQYDGNKNRNNVKIALSSIFGILSDESYIETNFIKEIRNKKVMSKPTKIYSPEEINQIIEILRENDFPLLMFPLLRELYVLASN